MNPRNSIKAYVLKNHDKNLGGINKIVVKI